MLLFVLLFCGKKCVEFQWWVAYSPSVQCNISGGSPHITRETSQYFLVINNSSNAFGFPLDGCQARALLEARRTQRPFSFVRTVDGNILQNS